MSNQIIRAKINCSAIDKKRLFQGKKGLYLNITLLPNKGGKDAYDNDYLIVEDVSKEEREAGTKGNILGNAKIVGGAPAAPRPARPSSPAAAPRPETGEDDVPF